MTDQTFNSDLYNENYERWLSWVQKTYYKEYGEYLDWVENKEPGYVQNVSPISTHIDSAKCLDRTFTFYPFNTKIVGVTFNNRQDVCARLGKGIKLKLIREQNNPHDKNAIAVHYRDEKAGYIKREIAADLALQMDQGLRLEATVLGLTGGGDLSYGVNIRIVEVVEVVDEEVSNTINLSGHQPIMPTGNCIYAAEVECTYDFNTHPISIEAKKKDDMLVCSKCASRHALKGEKCVRCDGELHLIERIYVAERFIVVQLKGENVEKECVSKVDTWLNNYEPALHVQFTAGAEKLQYAGDVGQKITKFEDIEWYYIGNALCNECKENEQYEEGPWGDDDWAEYYGMDKEDYYQYNPREWDE